MGTHAIEVRLIAMNERGNDVEPVAPTPPEPGDCCGDGCPRCVNDIYAEAMDRYEANRLTWRQRQQQGDVQAEQPGLSSGAGSKSSQSHHQGPHTGT